jgi:macrolide transport system ATP-binding/permease protein
VGHLLQDLRFGSRILWKSPGLSATAVILIALVIGGNTTIYSFVHSFITRPAPEIHRDGLVALGVIGRPGEFFHPIQDYLQYVEQSRTLRPLLGFSPGRFTVTVADGSYAFLGAAVTTNYFETLGVHIPKGRSFTEAENRLESSGLVAVISDRLWDAQFQRTNDIIGRTITLNGYPATIVGVAPPKFQGPILGSPDDVWVPIFAYTYLRVRSREMDRLSSTPLEVFMIGRLVQGTPMTRAQAEFATLSAQLHASSGREKNRIVAVVPYSATVAGGAIGGRQFLPIFSIVTALTLIIVCANVANLMLERAVVRQRETALRQSLGASRRRILSMLLAEGLTISLAAWVAACLFAFWTSRAVRWLLPDGFTNPQGIHVNIANVDFSPDWTVLAYAMLLAVAGTLVFTTAPAVHAWRQELLPGLKTGEQTVAPGKSRLTSVLVILQLAFSVLLLTSAGLAYRSLSLVETLHLNFDKNNLLLATVNPTLNIGNRELNLSVIETLRERLRTIPGIGSVSYVRFAQQGALPAQIVGGSGSTITARAGVNYVGPDYLKVFGLIPVAGRDVSTDDRSRTNKVAVVNQNLADTLWPGQQAVGQTIMLPRVRQPFEVIGVAPNAFFSGGQTNAHPNFIFLAEQQDEVRATGGAGFFDSGETTFYVKYAGSLDATISAVRRAVREVDERIPIVYLRTLDEQFENATFGQRVITTLLTLFSLVSLLIAAAGQYAVVAFGMRRRVREFGVRMAVGASSSQILRSVLKEGFTLTGIGLVVGFGLSLSVSIALRGFLIGVTPTDLRTYLGVFALLAMASVLACYLPARRASRVDPLVTLRYE